MTINVSLVKQKIIDYIKEIGPSLPANLTKITGMSLTFTSAILSELLAERKIKISNLKVGSSPLYYLEGQEEKLENFIDNLKPAEKDAFLKLKQNRILEDEKQSPQMRVALRSIKDFAIPMKFGERLFWKYHLLSDEKAKEAIGNEKKEEVAVGQERVIGQSIWNDIKKEFSREEIEEIIRKRVTQIVEKIKEEAMAKEAKKEQEKEELVEKVEIIKERKKPQRKKKTGPLFDFSKKIVEEKGFVIKEILKDAKDKVFLACSKENKNYLVFVYGRKSIDDNEIFKDYKKYFQGQEGLIIFVKSEKKEKFSDKKKFFESILDIFDF